jgi:hypothetical protein
VANEWLNEYDEEAKHVTRAIAKRWREFMMTAIRQEVEKAITEFHWLEEVARKSGLTVRTCAEVCENALGGIEWLMGHWQQRGDVIWDKAAELLCLYATGQIDRLEARHRMIDAVIVDPLKENAEVQITENKEAE